MINSNKTILSTDSRATELNSRQEGNQGRQEEIQIMSREDLIQTIIRCNVPFMQESNLKMQETEVLRRLTYMVIKHCNDLA